MTTKLADRRARLALFEHRGQRFAVIAHELPIPDGLTIAEREVCALLLQGRSDAEIATERGTSSRTVAGQVSRIYRKLGVGGRGELLERLLGPAGSSDPASPTS